MNLEDILYHLGEDGYSTAKPAAPPIYQTSNFIYSSVDEMSDALKQEHRIPFYTRGTNPTVRMLQQKLAALEETEEAMVFASGSAAIATALMSQVKQGDHIVCVDSPYSWTKKLIVQILNRFGVTYTFVDPASTEDIISAIVPQTKVIFLESPNSWTYEMQDMQRVADAAKKHGITTIMDNSCASPLFQKPANYGIDMIVHSASKYLTGHADMVAGVLCTSTKLFEEVFKVEYMTLGGIIGPIEAWMMIRSLRTLPLRMEKVSKNAMEVAKFLENHPKIDHLLFTHSDHYPQKDLVKKYLKAPGGLMTIDLKTEEISRIKQFCNSLQRFKLGCSWGAHESLAFPAIATADSMNYDKPNIAVNRVRLYIGLEDPEMLKEDLANALEHI